MYTVVPRIETVVTKHFSSIVPWFQIEGQLLYEGQLLIFHQGCWLVIRYCIAVVHVHRHLWARGPAVFS